MCEALGSIPKTAKEKKVINAGLGMVVTPVIPALSKLRQEDHTFEASQWYI
jgi:hypothetical protein